MIVVLNRVPAILTPLGDWLAEVAEDVALITSAEAAVGYRGTFPTMVEIEDYSTGAGTQEALELLCQANDVTQIVHVTEEDVLRAAQARDLFGIPGQSLAEALPFRDKLVMKQRVAAAGLRTPGFCAPRDLDEAHAFAAEFGWPVVVKPRLGYASSGVQLIRSEKQLTDEIAQREFSDILMEEYIPGLVYHVDGEAEFGELRYSCPSQYINDCLSFHDSAPLGSVQLEPSNPVAARLNAYTREVLAAMPPGDRSPFHLEVMLHEADGQLYFCEIASRLGGAHVPQALTYRTGVNPAESWIRYQAGLAVPGNGSIELSKELYGWVLIPPKRGTLLAIDVPDLPTHIQEFNVRAAAPQDFTGASASTDAVLSFVAKGETSELLERRLGEFTLVAQGFMKWM
ncbi:ATP-grasp domain-containing protein [Streptomyces europaeiscabiei]|uniref:ATP-grasp domain-containing protein n=1 Tax=Streptomyces TaxID=1883 RepID=UPI000A37E154|nr:MULTISPECIES: ATP-grasp domain-containing protein [Streptomyces]MDX3630112.1 ATP-grasp domain-containing protein [Streptomyces europaeiscabiei]MDX3652365.1 ATP-grasp domain-containing protein [Streptomyces europaeiscabiei]WUD31486.1 ATP-grasp domain-containing protein [Streptomyces europaeiscabiei]